MVRTDHRITDDIIHTWDNLKNGISNDKTIYIISDPAKEKESILLADQYVDCRIDGYHILLSPKNAMLSSGIDIVQECTCPKKQTD